jgi:tetratricopeptide (TPR) repeat protein
VLATRGDRAAALECYRAGLLYAPDDLELLRAAADGERESGGLAAARAGYERWLELAGGHAERASVIMALGDVLTRMEDFAGAVELLGPAVLELDERRGPLDPVVIDGRRGLVAALEALGRAEEAAVQRKRLP